MGYTKQSGTLRAMCCGVSHETSQAGQVLIPTWSEPSVMRHRARAAEWCGWCVAEVWPIGVIAFSLEFDVQIYKILL